MNPTLARTRRAAAVLIVPLTVALGGCSNTLPDWAQEMELSSEIDLATSELRPIDATVLFKDVVVGTGEEVSAGDFVEVHYTGWLTDGTEFDSSRERGTPATFQVGVRQLISGWDQAIPGMRVGGRRMLVIPPELGYGERGAGGGEIPPNAVLVFDVEVISLPQPEAPGPNG